jgi:CubicO group peptidase (beta-lactamase class C family)
MIQGTVTPGFEEVRRVFEASFASGEERGAAIHVVWDGKPVVDLWGGVADRSSGQAWTPDTRSVGFSASKGLTAAVALLLVERGHLDPDAPVARYWPEFARNGKRTITVRQLLNHRAGLTAIDAPLTLDDFQDLDNHKLQNALVEQVPAYRPGTKQAYAACAYGAYVGELVRRASDRTVGSWLEHELAIPLGAAVSIGRATDAPIARLYPVDRKTLLTKQVPEALTKRTTEGRVYRRVILGRRTLAGRAFLNPTLGPERFEVLNDADIQGLELPWMNALVSARGLARLYAALANGGTLDGTRVLSPETIAPVHRRQSWTQRDGVLNKPIGFSQGFVKEERHLFSPNPESFGHPGVGGSMGWADPTVRLGLGYVTNTLDWHIRSPRAIALCQAVYRSLSATAA